MWSSWEVTVFLWGKDTSQAPFPPPPVLLWHGKSRHGVHCGSPLPVMACATCEWACVLRRRMGPSH